MKNMITLNPNIRLMVLSHGAISSISYNIQREFYTNSGFIDQIQNSRLTHNFDYKYLLLYSCLYGISVYFEYIYLHHFDIKLQKFESYKDMKQFTDSILVILFILLTRDVGYVF
jgi:hypothetical protein